MSVPLTRGWPWSSRDRPGSLSGCTGRRWGSSERSWTVGFWGLVVGRGKVDHFSDVCLNIFSAGLGLPPPPLCFQLPSSACQSRVYLVLFGLVCESPLCKVETPRAPVVWRRGASLVSQGGSLTCWSSGAWLIECYASLTPCHNGCLLVQNFSNPAKKTTRGHRTGVWQKTARFPTAHVKADYRFGRAKEAHCAKATWRNTPTRIQNAEEPDCSHAGQPVGGAVFAMSQQLPPSCLISSDTTYSLELDIDVKIIWGWTNSSGKETEPAGSPGRPGATFSLGDCIVLTLWSATAAATRGGQHKVLKRQCWWRQSNSCSANGGYLSAIITRSLPPLCFS